MPAQTIQTMPREEFIVKNLGLVHACAGRFKSRGIEYEELYAAGRGTVSIPHAGSALLPMPCR